MTTTALTCASCSAALTEGDLFCGSCGASAATISLADDPTPTVETPRESPVKGLVTADVKAPANAALSNRMPFCRSCGTDHEAAARTCPECGLATGPMPTRQEGPIGLVYSFRRGLRKRRAIRIADTQEGATLLFESGETTSMALDTLPEPAESPLSDGELDAARTPPGVLLQLAAACRESTSKLKWDPEVLETAAVELAQDIVTTRLLAADAVMVGRTELLDRLPLTDSERHWLRAVDAAERDDPAAVVEAVTGLPPEAYRPKLGLLASQFPAARAGGVELTSLSAQLAPYLETEPLAALLHRALGGTTGDDAPGGQLERLIRDDRALAERIPLPAKLSDELDAALKALDGQAPAAPAAVHSLDTNARAMLALSDPRPGLIRASDVEGIPLSVIDDLIDAGAVNGDLVLAGSADPHRTRYLRGRVAPRTLSDTDIDGLDHHDERVRRIFIDGDREALDDLEDSPAVYHYRALVEATRQGAEPNVNDVYSEARPAFEDLLRLRTAKANDLSLTELLSERLLADPTIWPMLLEIADATALEPTPDLQSRFPAFVEWLALYVARERLFLGEWSAAVAAADGCLELAKAESVRDEALNLKACGLYNLGEDTQATAALQEAIEGAHSEALLANIGIVAAGLEPEIAAMHLGRLIDESPTVPLRVAAARRTLAIWQSSDDASWRNSDNSPLPDAFQDPLRRLAVGPIALEDFRNFACVLAIYDSEWMAESSNIAASPHAGTLEAEFYTARADNLTRMVAVMGKAMASGSAPKWVIDERDSLRSAAVDILFENIDEPDSFFGSVALAMVDEGVLATAYDRLLFTALGIAGVTYHLSERNDEIGDRIVGLVHNLRREWQNLDGEDRGRLEPLVELATRRVVINRMNARGRNFDEAVDVYNGAIDLGAGAQPGSPAYIEALRRCDGVSKTCHSIRDEIRQWVPIVDHTGVRDDLNKLIELTRELEGKCLAILN
jgi:hypothetical protein